ncbi:hypothetical protein GCM10025882_05440 [Acinetobacter gyllenbergii]|uniref:Uncharacterized protein n=1 Tax=Acinetobacter gyllenbergii CIP 110306 = MTCC 11365 TaxID=1217657 RepID=A0A829HKA4_9GAMM|nr:hypothetical protein [Acinetobacter gyllenbergii]EPF93138.1 hypothetical protein F957_00484 [Acinetobacter gyllenbergii CIP 110306 = MTCC 11365]EPH31448.1 hypothetical protein L293_2263 [Acinetobacter gyllenbergii CIP 110306 = MTCC 11365]ESK36812.1 hypothetical protein F987_03625 [Acinetobacter gyllenbergii NIPH 230]GMA10120.1 hypothetical protein GCM10025882_05440 [Acinetobacter gyllenbergii]
MTTVSIQGKNYGIYQFTGEVIDSNKQREMHVHGGGGATYQGTGGNAPVTSSTTIHDQFFLIDDQGQEHDVTLSNWNVTLRIGHHIQMIWVIPENKDRGPYVIVNNLNLKKFQRNDQAIRQLASDHYGKLFWGGVVGIIVISVMIKLILLPILGIIGAVIYTKKRKQVMTELQAAIEKEMT